MPISRRQTLALKWTVALVAIPLVDRSHRGRGRRDTGHGTRHTPSSCGPFSALASWMVAFTTLTLLARVSGRSASSSPC